MTTHLNHRPACRDCEHRHGEQALSLGIAPGACVECVPLPPEGFQGARVGYSYNLASGSRRKKEYKKTKRCRDCPTLIEDTSTRCRPCHTEYVREHAYQCRRRKEKA